ncbi:DUF1294 domain-containing protein [Solemya velesiana gill symbiont]|uniref:DNA-binding protein n=1 Tax=Solemya velesiana gill symbiont TaxID=1918948 RepID=A0A1T2KTB4_9GAMM|nr:DUF1294 domain-containing protein [Solemya velesiana gill symbiont]OOZ36099.1 DNA-binding protein [Solemya velesiana gill symbiont]
MRTKGKVSSWNDEKGYGFIEPIGRGKRIFIHINAFTNRSPRPEVNQIVTYALSTDKQGRPCAEKAALAVDRLSQQTKKSSGLFSIVGASIFLLLVAVAVFTLKAPLVILAVYLVVSLITFIAYALDKSAALKGNRRTPESTLHMLSLFGGLPGALIAQQKLRHKSKKQSFRSAFWLTVIANCGAFVWLLTPKRVDYAAVCT